MSLIKRGKVWHIVFTAPDGQRVRRSTGTGNKIDAQEFHDKLKAEYWRVGKLGDKPSRSWNEAVVRWLKETSHKASHETDKHHLRWLDAYLRDKALTDVSKDVIDQLRDMKKAEGVSNATVNRHMALVRSILRRACYEWEWIDRVPKVRMLPEQKRRIRWLTKREAARLLDELPSHLNAMARFSLATGLRQANVKELEWSQVDLARKVAWIHPDQAKARRAIAVPLNADALAVISEQEGNHPLYVFTYRGHPISQVNTKAWKAALRRAGITDFRWHDLRHTWASWHVQAGTPLHVLQELGGWESVEMVRRYAHMAAEHMAEYADRLSMNVSVSDTNLTQAGNQDDANRL